MERIEFEVLTAAAENKPMKAGFAGNEIKETVDRLEKALLLNNGKITEKGLEALEPYRVKSVVFMAAGFGSRMVPLTLNTPKPLVRVHGKRIIDTLLDAVTAIGIEDIYIVRGYLGEQFELLKKKYPTIKLIDNPDYDGTGTISSFYYARNLLDNTYVMESDLVVNNPSVIRKYRYRSGFMGHKVEETDDWYLKTENGFISEVGCKGSGDNCYKLVGISYWDHEDGKKLAHDIEEAYNGPDGHKLSMSFIPFRIYKEHYQAEIMPCAENDITEIDSFRELQAFDETYTVFGGM